MYHVYFMEHRKVLLNQLRDQVPAEGEELKIKGRKAKVANVIHGDDNKVQIQVKLEPVVKKAAVDLSKQKRR